MAGNLDWRGKGNGKRACVYASIPRVSRNEDMQMQSGTHTDEHDRSLAVKSEVLFRDSRTLYYTTGSYA